MIEVSSELRCSEQDHEAVTAASAALEERLSEQRTAAENLRNELQAARQEAAALEAQLTKERTKLAATREERTRLRDQVTIDQLI